MKIMMIEGNSRFSALPEPAFTALPDSALLLSGRPYFIPEFDSEFEAYISPVVKIDRLGKSIAPKFASRYYHQMSVAISMRPKNLVAKLRAAGLPDSLALVYDRAVIVGDFIPVGEMPADKETIQKIELCVDGELMLLWKASDMKISIGDALELCSRHNTLKTGDLIAYALSDMGTTLRRPSTISMIADGRELLTTNIR